MSSAYYFNKWREILKRLENLIERDVEYQETKAHDQKCCDAVQRLTGILGMYINCYNEAVDCLQQNLQVQKTVYINDIVKALVARILEIKEQLRKLEGAFYHFLNNGIISYKITPFDVEFHNVLIKHERSKEINEVVVKALQKAKEIKIETDRLNEVKSETSENTAVDNWWEDSIEKDQTKPIKKMNMMEVYEVEIKISEETLQRRQKLSLILAHEKTRQVTSFIRLQKQRRDKWFKELEGTLNPPARIELREKAAKLIQRFFRFYFKVKMQKVKDCKRDELLQLTLCNIPLYEESSKDKELRRLRSDVYNKYEEQRAAYIEKYKNNIYDKKHEEIAEDIRDNTRNWFQNWYKEAKFFYQIPKERQGGSTLIVKEEIPSPSEWSQKYKEYIEHKKANKNKNAQQLKWEKQAAIEEEMMLKREEMKKKKLEAELLKKMMKNPSLHPGYQYPPSKKTEHLIQTIKNYYQIWLDLDNDGNSNVKEKFIKSIDEEDILMDINFEIHKLADVDMREELQLLQRALKEEYKENEEEMPKPMKEKATIKKKKRRTKIKINDDIYDKLSDLALKDILKEYPTKHFMEFLGDSNYAGDSIRCNLEPTAHFGAEIKAVWWELSEEVGHGFKRILLVGPRGSGKATLVHIMASVTDAVLYELNPNQLSEEHQTAAYLEQLIQSLAICAKTTQPSIIYIKDVHKLYYNKVPPTETNIDFDLMKRFFIRYLLKKLHRHDNVTIIGSCTEPWLAKSKQLLKIFPIVILMPSTSYSAVYLILWNWVLMNRVVPPDLDIHSLAHVLQGYSFGYLIKALHNFLTADRIVNIAAYGLTPQALYDYVIEDEAESKIDYNKYLKWFAEKTRWGKLENKRLQEDREFKMLEDEWHQKMKIKKKI